MIVIAIVWSLMTGNIYLTVRIMCYVGISIGFGIALAYNISGRLSVL